MRFKQQAIAKSILEIIPQRTAYSVVGSLILATSVVAPTPAQIPPLPGGLRLPTLEQLSNGSSSDSNNQQIDTAWIRLDGRRLFQIASTTEQLPKRVEEIQQQLQNIAQDYFQSNSSELEVEVLRVPVKKANNSNATYPVIYVNNQRLLTVTSLDAKALGEDDIFRLAQRWRDELKQDLERAKQERQPPFLERQGAIAGGVFLAIVLGSWGIHCWQRRLQSQLVAATIPTTDSVTTHLTQKKHKNLQEVRQRLFQLAQGIIWSSGTLAILGLFPHTRFVQLWTFTALKVPFAVGIVGLGTYVAIRLSYALIDQFTTALANNALVSDQDYVRLQLRVITISGVAKSIATLSGVAIGTLLALSTLGVNIVPVLAGASLIGVALSLASQSLIKDAINGFLIILEDQYAVGDVINVGEFGGLVENLNLRITQLRDSEGRLITIPNSEIKAVANLSSRWSRADLSIPVAYDTNVDQVIKLVDTVGLQMEQDPQWQEQILEQPQVLGVDNFGDRGFIVRVWIKTQPLKQWDVAREFRRRLKIAFDRANITIPVAQQTIWVNNPQALPFPSDDKNYTPMRK